MSSGKAAKYSVSRGGLFGPAVRKGDVASPCGAEGGARKLGIAFERSPPYSGFFL